MIERLQKIISARGIASRRKAEEMIAAGRITVNGIPSEIGTKADPDVDEILMDGRPLPSSQNFVYILLNKPRGYVTTLSDEKGRKNVASLVADCGTRVYPVGRLDMDSEGLLIMTNDGDFANRMMHPSHETNKTYQVWISGYKDDTLALLRRPVILDGYQIHPPKVSLLSEDLQCVKLEITIHEGRNRQIRRMCELAGVKVIRLRRVREGDLSLGRLPVGKWRYLMDSEVSKLR